MKKHVILLTGLCKAGLKKMKVSERIIYQLDELESIIKSSLEISKDIKRIVRELDIKMASVKISACKPVLWDYLK